MPPNNYQELFYPEYWRRLALDQRVRLLQDLENDHAKQSGRSPYTVKPVPMPTFGACGKMDPDKREILVNESHIQHDPLEFVAIHTVLHEGRHAYQKAAIDNPALHHNREQTQVWKENAAVYIQNSEKMLLVYWNQTIERDAQDYAYNELIKIADRLEEKHGKIDLYQRYITTVETEARFMAEKSRAKYGDDYIVKIDKALQQAYSITKGLDGDKTNALEVPPMEKTVNFDVMVEKNGQKVQETVAVKTFEINEKQRETTVRGLEKRVIEAVAQTYGNDFTGMKIEVVPNFHDRVDKEAAEKATWQHNTIAIAKEAQININHIIWGYEITHDVKENERAYFIVMERADGKGAIAPIKRNKGVSAEEQISQESQIVNNARQFVYDNTRNLEDLKSLSVRVEEARGLSYIPQQEYYFEIGMNQMSAKEYAGSLDTYIPNRILSEYELNVEFKTKGLEGDKQNAREVPAMENTVNFDVTIEKDGKKAQETIAVKPFHDLRNPNFDYEPWNSSDKLMESSEMFEINEKQREAMVRGLEKRVLEAAAQTYGNDLNGVTVDIRPNYNSQVYDDALKNTLVDLMREADPTANVEELRSAVEQSILYHKEQHSYYFPGNENNGISHGKENSFIEREILERIEQNEDTRRVVLNAASNVKDIIKGYEAVNQKNANTESYFIVINRPGEEPMARNVAVDKNISQEELKDFLKKEANGFINEHVRNTGDLNGMSVRAEKANGLSNDGQREFYRQIGSLSTEKSFEDSVEITR